VRNEIGSDLNSSAEKRQKMDRILYVGPFFLEKVNFGIINTPEHIGYSTQMLIGEISMNSS